MMVSWYTPSEEEIQGGIFHYEQAKALQDYCDVSIYWPYDRTIKPHYTHTEDWGIDTYRSQYHLKHKIRNRLYMLQAMRNIKKTFRPDLIHAHVATEAGRFAAALGKLFHIPVMITEHSAPEGSEVDHFPHYYYAKFAYGSSRYNACVSDYLRQYLQKLFPKFVFHTVYNGITAWDYSNEAAKIKKDNRIDCAIVANFYDEKIKGHHLLLPAIARIRKEGINVYLHLVGSGEYQEHYRNCARDLEIEEYCIFYGHCDKVRVGQILSGMDFLVSASLFESFGCTIAEAMMIGLPVVATRCGGPESIVNEENGVLVEKNSEDALYEGIKSMCAGHEKYSRDAIQRYAREKFSVDSIARQYMVIYGDIVQSKEG